MKLSIVILFCDKDYIYIPSFIKEIKKEVKINYEIILIDNREKKKNCLINTHGVPIHSNGKNLYTFESRRIATKYITGDYVWFIDADDKVLPIQKETEELLKKNYEMIVFNVGQFVFVKNEKEEKIPIFSILRKNEEAKTNDVTSIKTAERVYVSLWNKWIKTDIWKKTVSLIPTGIKMTYLEDTLYSFLALKNCKNVYFENNSYYIYNRLRSNMDKRDCSYEWYKNLLIGVRNALNLFEKLFTEEELFNYKLDKITICTNLLKHIFLSVLESEQEKCYKDLQTIFTYKEMYYSAEYGNNVECKEIYEGVKELFKKYENRNADCDTRKIKSIKQKVQSFSVQLELGTFCNFNCSYCYQGNCHNIDDREKGLELVENWEKVDKYLLKTVPKEKGIVLSFIGGETTLYPLTDLLNKIWEKSTVHFDAVRIFTNGSNKKATLDFILWCKNHNTTPIIFVTFHEEFITVEKYIDFVNTIKKECTEVYLSTVVTNKNIDTILDNCNIIKKETSITPIISPAYYNNFPVFISKENKQKIKEYENNELVHKNLQCTLSDGSVYSASHLEALEVVLDKTVVPFNAKCDTGKSFLFISQNGNCCFNSSYCNKKSSNIITDDEIDLGETDIICNRGRCSCLAGNNLIFE